ncbi:MAG: hypothetical protein ACR2GD_09385 [Pyrinomonadaceae bacterium]
MKEATNIRDEQKITNENSATGEKNETLKRIGIVGAIALVAFLLGFVPMWISTRNYESERDAAIKTLRPSVLQNNLATAALNAQRGDYEQARQQTSDFFTALRAEVDRQESAFDAQQRAAAQPILAQRDDLITLLARGDAASAGRLSDLYFAFTQMKNAQPAAPQKK